MCGHTRDPIIYSKFYRNPFRGFGAPGGGQNLAFPITLASRFYNSCTTVPSVIISRNVARRGQTGSCCCGRKYVRVLLVGMTDVHLRLSDWQLVTDSGDAVALLCLNNLQEYFVRRF